VHKDQTGTGRSLIVCYQVLWQRHLALLGRYSSLDSERPNLRSWRLVVVFHAKASVFAKASVLSGWFYNSTVKKNLVARE